MSTTASDSRSTAGKDTGPHVTKRENAEHGFLASKSLTDDLQRVLVDLVELHIQGKQAHWNVVGKNFRDLHLQLDEIIEAGREFSDDVAERLRALHASVDGRTSTVASTTTLEQFPDGEVDTALVVVPMDVVISVA